MNTKRYAFRISYPCQRGDPFETPAPYGAGPAPRSLTMARYDVQG